LQKGKKKRLCCFFSAASLLPLIKRFWWPRAKKEHLAKIYVAGEDEERTNSSEQ
jgi:hypothetical protein